MTKDNSKRAKEQAKTQLESIIEMVENLNTATNSDNDDKRERAEQTIYEDPLSVQVRTGWCNPGETNEPEEYTILLCTGGPAVRIIGDLGRYSEPESAKIEYQDWFTLWTDYPLSQEEEKTVIEYARCFLYGDF